MYDKNGDSKITIDEFADVIKSLGLNPSSDQLVDLMKEIDLDSKNTQTTTNIFLFLFILLKFSTKK